MPASTGTHFSKLSGKIRVLSAAPATPDTGDEYWNSLQHGWFRYDGTKWIGILFTVV